MKHILILSIWILIACTPNQVDMPPATSPATSVSESILTNPPSAREKSVTSTPAIESTYAVFSDLVLPTCSGFTPENTEGPYYTPDTLGRNSLLEDGMPGEKIVLIGYVLDANCQPVPNAWLDFWQADATGEYDNAGYILRGHQFTDEQGRYYLETILPGLYASRPIRHIHVKAQMPNGEVITTQLYFPEQPVDGLTVQLNNRDGYKLAIFNFVLR